MKDRYNAFVYRIVEKAELINDYKIVQYGLSQGIALGIFVLISSTMSISLGNGIEGILFLIFFYFLRTYAGGYHAETKKKCWCISVGIIVMINIFLKRIFINLFIESILLVSAAIHLSKISPKECKNKPLEDIEKKLYRKIVKRILILYLAIYIVCVMLNRREISKIVFISVILSELLVCLERINQRK